MGASKSKIINVDSLPVSTPNVPLYHNNISKAKLTELNDNRTIFVLFGYKDPLCSYFIIPRDVFNIILHLISASERVLIGHDFQSWAIGGTIFSITAKRSITLTNITLRTRSPGNFKVKVRRGAGEWREFEEISKCSLTGFALHRSNWNTIVPRRSYEFGIPSIYPSVNTSCVVWQGQYTLKRGDIVSWLFDNFGNESNGELCGKNVTGNNIASDCVVEDENISISPIAFLDRSVGMRLYGESYMYVGFIGDISYETWI